MSFADSNPYSDCNGPDREKVCDCINNAGNVIAVAIAALGDKIGKKTDDACEIADKCIDKIYDKIKAKVEKGAKTCQECQQMARAGAAGTIEYAVACAGACIKDCETTCSKGDPTTEGKCCNTCGSPSCTCKDGTCVKAESQPGEFIGWCNGFTGVFLVTKKGEPDPGNGFTKVATTSTETEAITAAQAACTQPIRPPTIITPYAPPNVAPFSTPNCSILDYGSSAGVSRVINKSSGAATQAAIIGLINNVIQSAIASTGTGGAVAILQGGAIGLAQIPAAALQITPPLVAAAVGCSDDNFNAGIANLCAIGLLERYTGLDVSDFKYPIHYAMHSLCRQVQLSPESAMSAFLANAKDFDYKTLDTHYGIAGICPKSVEWQLQAQKSKPIPGQLASLRRRKLIDDTSYNDGMRQLGYLEQGVVDNLFKLTEQLPGLSDIIRLMVRDADDESIPYWPESDKLFEQKYGSKLKEWGESQGIPPDFAKLAWRAHWSIPAPTQLFEFYHRLRKNDKFGGEPKLLEAIKGALIQQDILPFWHDYYLETSFRPMTRVDIRRAYNIGTIKYEELPLLYAQLGYSDEVSDRMAKFTDKLRDIAIPSNHAIKLWKQFSITRDDARARMLSEGLPEEKVDKALLDTEPSFASSSYAIAFVRGDITRQDLISFLADIGVSNNGAIEIANRLAVKITNHKALKGYAVGALDRNQAFGKMSADGMDTIVSGRLLDEVTEQVDYDLILRCQAGIKRKYLLGEVTLGEASDELVKRGTVKERADKLTDWWDCEKTSRGKHVAISKLCSWLASGVINIADFTTRTKRLGYNDADAALLTEDCLTAINTARQAQARKQAKDEQSQAQKAANAAVKQQRALEREAGRMETARLASNRARSNREKQIMSAADKLAKKCDCDIYRSVVIVRAQRDRVIREFGLSVDEALQVLILAIEGWEGGDPSLYANVVTLFAETAVSEAMADANQG